MYNKQQEIFAPCGNYHLNSHIQAIGKVHADTVDVYIIAI